jgi:hypothetical protein
MQMHMMAGGQMQFPGDNQHLFMQMMLANAMSNQGDLSNQQLQNMMMGN